MQIHFPVERVGDANVTVHVNAFDLAVALAKVTMAISLSGKIAGDDAIGLAEVGKADGTVIISIGPQETLRSALAIGADNVIPVKTGERAERAAEGALIL